MKNKKILIIFLSSYFLLLFVLSFWLFNADTSVATVIAADAPLVADEQVGFPRIEIPHGQAVFLPDYIRQLYKFAVLIGGLVALIAFLVGGFQYLTSAGNPSKMSEAIERIGMGFLGLIIILGSYIFLVQMNPDLVALRTPHVRPIGILVVLYSDNRCGDGMDAMPGIKKVVRPEIRFEMVRGGRSISPAMDVGSFFTTGDYPDLIRVTFFDNEGCLGEPMRHGSIPTPVGTANTCVSPEFLLKNVRCVSLSRNIPGVWLFNYEDGDPTEPKLDEEHFYAHFTRDAPLLPRRLTDNVRSIAIVPDKRLGIHFGAILRFATGDRLKITTSHLHIPPPGAKIYLSNTSENQGRLFTTNNRYRHIRSIVVFRIDKNAPNKEIRVCYNVGCKRQRHGGKYYDAYMLFNWDDDNNNMKPIPYIENTAVARAINLYGREWWPGGHRVRICELALGMFCGPGVSSIEFDEGAQYIAILHSKSVKKIPNTRPHVKSIIISGTIDNLGIPEFKERTGIIYIIKTKGI